MPGIILYVVISAVIIYLTHRAFMRLEQKQLISIDRLSDAHKLYLDRFNQVIKDIDSKEDHIQRILTLYRINNRLSHLMSESELLDVFVQELGSVGGIDTVLLNGSEYLAGHLSYLLSRENGRNMYIHVSCSDRQLAYQIPYLVYLLRILLDRALIYRKLHKMSITDYLTAVANRRYFWQRFRQEFNRARKFSLSLSFIMIDLDHFKLKNDTYGHLVGDEILRQSAALLKETIREIDFIGRYGGEEFAIFMPETDRNAAENAAERLRMALSNAKFKVYDEEITVTASFGVGTYPDSASDKEALVEIADSALYEAKSSGRNCVVIK